jgi:enoyl-CoA hydratase
MSSPAVRYSRVDHIVELVLDRPENRNAMTPELLGAFDGALDRLASDRGVRAVIVGATGPNFCSGADFRSSLLGDVAVTGDHFPVYRPFLRLLDVPVPVIAAMSGHAVGGGLGLALVCDIRIAAEDARYGANFVRLGLAPGMGISYLLPRVIGVPLAMEYLVTGRLFDGATAHRIGFANHVVPADQVLPTARALAGQIAAASPTAVAMTKRALLRGLDVGTLDAARIEAREQAATAALPDFAEGVAALLDKREPVFGDVADPLPDD